MVCLNVSLNMTFVNMSVVARITLYRRLFVFTIAHRLTTDYDELVIFAITDLYSSSLIFPLRMYCSLLTLC